MEIKAVSSTSPSNTTGGSSRPIADFQVSLHPSPVLEVQEATKLTAAGKSHQSQARTGQAFFGLDVIKGRDRNSSDTSNSQGNQLKQKSHRLNPQRCRFDKRHFSETMPATSTGHGPVSTTTFTENKDLIEKTKANLNNQKNSRFTKNRNAKKDTEFNPESHKLERIYRNLTSRSVPKENGHGHCHTTSANTGNGLYGQSHESLATAAANQIVREKSKNFSDKLITKKKNYVVDSLATILNIEPEVAETINPKYESLRPSVFQHEKRFYKKINANYNKAYKDAKSRFAEVSKTPRLDERKSTSSPVTKSTSQLPTKSNTSLKSTVSRDLEQTSDDPNSSSQSMMPNKRANKSHSFHSFTKNNDGTTWEEHLLKNLSKSTAEWLVLERSNTREDRAKMAKLMNFDESKKDVQLVHDSVRCAELEKLNEQIKKRNMEMKSYEAKIYSEAKLENLAGDCGVDGGNLEKTTLARVVSKSGRNRFDDIFNDSQTSMHPKNRTAIYDKDSILIKKKSGNSSVGKSGKYKNTSKEVKDFLARNNNKTFKIDKANSIMAVGKTQFDLTLEEKFPPNLKLVEVVNGPEYQGLHADSQHEYSGKKGFRKWIDDPKFHKVDKDTKELLENLFKNDINFQVLSSHDKKAKILEPDSGPFALIKEWARQSYFDISWQAISVGRVADLLLNIHEQDNLQGIIYILLAITSKDQVDFPAGLINLVERKVLNSPRYKMVCKLLKVLKDKAYLEDVISNILPELELQDTFFLSHFILNLSEIEEFIDSDMHLLLIENITKALFEPDKIISSDKEKSNLTVNRILKLLKNLCQHPKNGGRNATGIINVAGEHLQSVRSTERCLALDIIQLAGKLHNTSANNCILERINHLLWNDSNLEVRSNAGTCLNVINAGHIVYKDLLQRFSTVKTSTNRLWCLSVVRKLKIITAQILPCYISCFDDKEHADVRLLACQIAHDLGLKSETVYNKLVFLAQTDTSDYVKAAAIKSLINFSSADTALIKLLCWAVTFENNPFVRLSAINALEELKALKPPIRVQADDLDVEFENGTSMDELTGEERSKMIENDQNQESKNDPTNQNSEIILKVYKSSANADAIKELKERAIIEQNPAVKFKIKKVLKDQCDIICKDSDLKELQMIKEQVGNLCTKDKVIELLMAN